MEHLEDFMKHTATVASACFESLYFQSFASLLVVLHENFDQFSGNTSMERFEDFGKDTATVAPARLESFVYF